VTDIQRIDGFDLLKIDSEGGGMEVFRGADRLVRRYCPSEVLDLITRAWGYSAAEIMGYFDIMNMNGPTFSRTGSQFTPVRKRKIREVGTISPSPLEKQGSVPLRMESEPCLP
jgi:hypothetical protein